MLIGPRLLPDDRVRIVSPASIPDRDQVAYGADFLRSWGLRVEMDLHVFDSHGHFLAGRMGTGLPTSTMCCGIQVSEQFSAQGAGRDHTGLLMRSTSKQPLAIQSL